MAAHKRQPQELRLLITGGGTGGHLFPAIAAAQALRSRYPRSEVLFIGTRRKIDTTSLDNYGFASSSIFSYGLKGKNMAELVKAIAVLPFSVVQAAIRIRKFRPDVVLGVGGYVTGPVMLAAKLLGVPTVIHEQNSVPGMANRKLGALVDRICLSLPGSERFFPAEKRVMTGNPVRENILALSKSKNLKEADSPLTLLVLGGSQGAHALNKVVTETLCTHSDLVADLRVIHQTGRQDAEWVDEQYRKAHINAEVAPFFHDMADVYKRADFLVSRAGATTLTELAVLGKPAVLVPYPYAADDHQQKNAEYYAQSGGARCIPEIELDSARLQEVLTEISRNRDMLKAMAESMRKIGTPEAAEKIVHVCLGAAQRRGRVSSQPVSNSVE